MKFFVNEIQDKSLRDVFHFRYWISNSEGKQILVQNRYGWETWKGFMRAWNALHSGILYHIIENVTELHERFSSKIIDIHENTSKRDTFEINFR